MPGAGQEDGELVINGDKVSVWESETVLEINGGDVCTTTMHNNVNVLHAAEMYT